MRRFLATALGLAGAVAMLVSMLAQRYVAEIDDGRDPGWTLGKAGLLAAVCVGLAAGAYFLVRL